MRQFRHPLTALPAAIAMAMITPPVAAELMHDAIEAFSEDYGGGRIDELDMDQSGIAEILLVQDQGCAAEGCAWELLQQRASGDVTSVSSGLAHTARLEATGDAGGVLYTDGITWALMDGFLNPYGDILGLTQQRSTSLAEIEAIQEMNGFSEISSSDVASWSFSYILDEEDVFAHVHVITHFDYQVNQRYAPYMIFDQGGDLLAEGLSEEFPRIFPDVEEGGFTVVDVIPAGFSVQRFE